MKYYILKLLFNEFIMLRAVLLFLPSSLVIIEYFCSPEAAATPNFNQNL